MKIKFLFFIILTVKTCLFCYGQTFREVFTKSNYLFRNSFSLSWEITDTLSIFDKSFLGVKLDTNKTSYFITNNLIEGRNYTNVNGIFYNKINTLFINFQLEDCNTNINNSTLYSVSFFLNKEIYSIYFSKNQIFSMSHYWQSKTGTWVESISYSRNLDNYFLDQLNINSPTLKIELDQISKNFIHISSGKRTKEEIYDRIF